jgi:hypothetical protein
MMLGQTQLQGSSWPRSRAIERVSAVTQAFAAPPLRRPAHGPGRYGGSRRRCSLDHPLGVGFHGVVVAADREPAPDHRDASARAGRAFDGHCDA